MRFQAKAMLFILAVFFTNHYLYAQTVADQLYRTIGTFNPTELYVTDVAVGSDGAIHAVDYFHRTITKYSSTGSIIWRIVDPMAKGLPRRITLDENDHTYVVYDGWTNVGVYDTNGNRLRYINVDWGSSKTTGIAARGGKLYATSSVNGTVPRIYDIATGAMTGEIVLPPLGGDAVRRPADVIVLNDGSVYIMDRAAMRVEMFDSQGGYTGGVHFERGTQPGQLTHLTALAIDVNGNIYISDRYSYSVTKFSPTGEFLWRIGEKGKGPGRFDQHLGIAYSSRDDTVWVAGYHNHDIQQFNAEGTPIQQWVGFESGPGDFAYAEGVAASTDRIYVADRYNQRIQVFDKNSGQHLFSFGQRGDDPESNDLEFPRGLAIDRENNIYVAEYRRVKKFTPDGEYLTHYDYRAPASGNKADIKGAQGLAVTPASILFFADRANSQVDKRNASTGELLRPLGAAVPQRLQQPWGVAFSKSERHLYITDGSANSVVVLGRTGAFLGQWSTPTRPYGVAVDDKYGIVYVGGVNRIFAYTLGGTLLRSWDARNSEQLNRASNVTFGHLFVDEQGAVYASDMVGTVNIYRRQAD